MPNITDILKERQPVKVKSERAELVKFFVEHLKNKDGKPFSPKRIAVALSHMPTKDIYYMISVYNDIKNRSGEQSAQKWFWWSIKCKK